MSRVDELIAELCPDGVTFRALGDIATLVRGNGMPKNQLVNAGVGAIHYGEIYTRYEVSTGRTLSFVTPETAAGLAKVNPGDIIITNTSENVDDVGKAVAWLGDGQIVTGGHATVIRHREDPKFLSYWFASEGFSLQKRKLASGTKVIDVSAKQMAKVRVPLPPIEVQQEVVRVLDQLTNLQAELKTKIDAELEARRLQHERYRELILREIEGERISLGELGKWQGGITPSKSNLAYWTAGEVPWLASMDVSDESTEEIRGRVTYRALAETSLKVVPSPAVAVVMRSNILRRRLPIGLLKVDTTVNQDIRALIPRAGVDAEYVYQVLRATSELIRSNCVRTDGSMAAVNSADFFAWEIPLPSIEEQRKVASELQRLDALVNDLARALPSELAARRKQYEYYRDKLLMFKELPA